MRPVWAEINLNNLAFNIRQIRRITNENSKILAVVKADAYGHGVVETSQVLLENGADGLGVAILDEAVKLREKGFTAPIVILGYTPESDFPQVVQHNLIQTIYEYSHAELLSREALRQNFRIPVHVKIDTGMGRLGFLPAEDTIDILAEMMELPGIYVEGIYTHLANADVCDSGYTEEQLERYFWFLNKLEERNVKVPIRHAANSAGILNYPQAHLDMVRPGIVLYGLLPYSPMENAPELKPVMSLKAQIASVKKMPVGSKIGYGCTCELEKNCVIAVLPLGYADGYTRHFSNNCCVLVGGHRVPLLGRVCMDQIMVDVSEIPDVAIGDEAVLLGQQESAEITAEELALQAGTINYEIVCMISHRVPRTYIK